MGCTFLEPINKCFAVFHVEEYQWEDHSKDGSRSYLGIKPNTLTIQVADFLTI